MKRKTFTILVFLYTCVLSGCSLVYKEEMFLIKTAPNNWGRVATREYTYQTDSAVFTVNTPYLGITKARYGVPFIPIGLFPASRIQDFDSTLYKKFYLRLMIQKDKDSIDLEINNVSAHLSSGDNIPATNQEARDWYKGLEGKYFKYYRFDFDIPYYKTADFKIEFKHFTMNNKEIQLPAIQFTRGNYWQWSAIFIPTH